MNDKLLYRISEVAEHPSISRSKVYRSGELRSVHIDRSRLVRARDLPGTLTPWPPLRDCQHHCEMSGRTRSSARHAAGHRDHLASQTNRLHARQLRRG